MSSPALLGRDALKSLGLNLVTTEQKAETEAITEILNINTFSQESEVDSLDINPEVSVRDRMTLSQLYMENYVVPERPKIPETKAEVRLIVKDTQPFHF